MQTATKAKKSPLVPVVVIAVVLVAGYLIIRHGGHGHAGSGRASPGIPVTLAPVKVGSFDIYLDAIGAVTPVSTVTVTSRVVGALAEVHYAEGQLVKKGDLLAVIDPRPYQAALLQAKGQLARDQAILHNARLDLERYQSAYEQHAIPEQQYATQKALVDGDAGTVQLDQGNLDTAQVNLDYTRILSPVDGRVGLRQVDPGNIVQANGTTPLTIITQLQPITVIFTIAEDHLSEVVPEVAKGNKLAVLALDRAQQKQIARGTLLTLDNQVDPATGTVKARAIFDNKSDELFPSQFVNARLLLKTLQNIDLIPAAAVQMNDTLRFVYVVGPDGKVQSRTIKVTSIEGETAAVTGVKPGEIVVTDGFDRLQNGVKVTARVAAVPTAAAGATGAP